MIVFEDNIRVNFVDINNVFVGYGLEQDCCENAGYFINEKELDNIPENHSLENSVLKEYVFDTKYFKEVLDVSKHDGSMVRFKLIALNHPDLFLHLYNYHNGYYGHGFESKIGDQKWMDGIL